MLAQATVMRAVTARALARDAAARLLVASAVVRVVAARVATTVATIVLVVATKERRSWAAVARVDGGDWCGE